MSASPGPNPDAIGIPNIPPRSSSASANDTPGSAPGPRSLGALSPTPASHPARKSPSPPHALSKQSTENLSRGKTSGVLSPSGRQSSLTVQLSSSLYAAASAAEPATSSRQAQALDSNISRHASSGFIPAPSRGSGTSTPHGAGDSSFSNLAEVSVGDKAKVLRRHLVSAEERSRRGSAVGQGAGVGGISPGRVSPLNGAPDGKMSSAVVMDEEEDEEGENFPIPYDAPGGDVTLVLDLLSYNCPKRVLIDQA
jgi:proton-coupled amino acid transporter